MRILLTGASGFVGSALAEQLVATDNVQLVAGLRQPAPLLTDAVEQVIVGGLGKDTGWSFALRDVDIVIHTAARVHVMNDAANDPLTEFRKVNLEGTMALAKQAVKSGVKRFIFISSIKVNGEETIIGEPFTADDEPAPMDPYGVSKAEAEQALMDLAATTGMEVVIIRPVLVYGPGVKANFRILMKWLSKGIPLPLGLIRNKRSLVALDNLVDLIITCIDHPAAANQIFLVSDGEDLSTTELLQRVGKALGKSARLIPVPACLINIAAMLIGKRDVSKRLFGSLQVDISKTCKLLDWAPPVSVDVALKRTTQSFLQEK